MISRIPKTIHYCWYGPNPIPALELRCIESWKKYFPDYNFKLWDENAFDITHYTYAKQAYDEEYYAFVSDFVRVMVLAEYGGIYLDTDVEVLVNFSDQLKGYEAVLGFENSTHVGTAVMAFVPDHDIMTEFAEYYKKRSFVKSNGEIEMTTNPFILADILENYGIKLNGKEQKVDGIKIFNRNKFFPKKISENDFKTTGETVTIHHFRGSWLTPRQKRRGQNIFWIEVCRPILRKCKDICSVILGDKRTKKLENKIKNWLM